MNVTALLPCRAGSQRIKNKNVKKFVHSSLVEIKLDQLLKAKKIKDIVVSTDDEKVIKICQRYRNPRIKIQHRNKYFASNKCHTDELIKYIIDIVDYEYLLWTHVTSPFIDEKIYDKAINVYREKIKEGHDSLVSVDRCQEFIWDGERKPVNYNIKRDGVWPKTQKVKPIYIINSGIFIASKDIMVKYGNRIGRKAYYFETNIIESFDIDWEDDFVVAEKIWKALKA